MYVAPFFYLSCDFASSVVSVYCAAVRYCLSICTSCFVVGLYGSYDCGLALRAYLKTCAELCDDSTDRRTISASGNG